MIVKIVELGKADAFFGDSEFINSVWEVVELKTWEDGYKYGALRLISPSSVTTFSVGEVVYFFYVKLEEVKE